MIELYELEAESPEREVLSEEFHQLTRTFREFDELSQMLVGNSINMANRLFLKRHGSAADFVRLPKREQAAYVHGLTATEDELREGDPEAALGFVLFGMWLSALISRDEELVESFWRELVHFGEKGDMTRYFR